VVVGEDSGFPKEAKNRLSSGFLGKQRNALEVGRVSALLFLQVVVVLQPQPEFGRVAEVAAKAQGRVGRDAAPALQYLREAGLGMPTSWARR